MAGKLRATIAISSFRLLNMPAQRRRQSSVAMRRADNPGYYAEEARCGNAPKATATGFHFPSPAAVRGYGRSRLSRGHRVSGDVSDA